MKRLPPNGRAPSRHAREIMVNVARIVSDLRWDYRRNCRFDACLARPAWREIAISGSKKAEATASLQVVSVAISRMGAIVLDV